jgi:hypothetical protein
MDGIFNQTHFCCRRIRLSRCEITRTEGYQLDCPSLRTSGKRFPALHPYPARRLVWSPLRASSDRCFPIFSPEGGLDWSPTARIQRGESATARCTSIGDHLACPLLFQACSFSLQGWGLIELPLCAAFSPAHPLAGIFTRLTLRLFRNRLPETCHELRRGPSIISTSR